MTSQLRQGPMALTLLCCVLPACESKIRTNIPYSVLEDGECSGDSCDEKKLNTTIKNDVTSFSGVETNQAEQLAFAFLSPTDIQVTATPLVSWSGDDKAQAYNLSVGRVEGCASPLQSYEALTTTFKTLSALPDGTYFLCLSAKDRFGNVIDARNTNFVLTIDATSPNDNNSFTIDLTAPTVAITTSSAAITKVSPIPVTVTFSEPTSSFVDGDIVVTGGTKTNITGSGTTYTFGVTPSGNGLVTVAVAAGVANDNAGNANLAATTLSLNYDNTRPSVTITSSEASPTNTSPIPVTVTFSETVADFDANDIAVSGGTKGALSGSGTTYTLNVTPSGEGMVSVGVAADVASDLANNGNTAATTFSVLYYVTAPSAPTVTAAATSANLSWSALPGATSYVIFWATTAGVTATSNAIATSGLTYQHQNLSPWHSYYYRFAGVTNGLTGPLSAEASLSGQPTFSASLDDSSSGVFCPRLNLSFTPPPGTATQYCITQNTASAAGCAWSDLPIPATVHAVDNNSAVALSLWLRDGAGNVFMNGNPVTASAVTVGPTQLPTSRAAWAAVLADTAIASATLDEVNCRIDELTAAQGLAAAGIRRPVFSANQRRKLSQQLNRVVLGTFGLTPAMSAADAQKALWRLMITTHAATASLAALDLSAVDLSGHHVGGFTFAGSNISGAQLNAILPASTPLDFSGLDLTGWNPGVTQPLAQLNIANATHVPWGAINANTTSKAGSNFSGVDLTGWNPAPDSVITGMNFTGATNIPWAAINALTGSLSGVNFTGQNLAAWNPPAATNVTSMILDNTTNVPWAALNLHTQTGGLGSISYKGVDFTGFNPPAATDLISSNFSDATNIPWAVINANTNGNSLNTVNWTGQNLSAWNPPTARFIGGTNYTNATNLPWAAINANTGGVYRSIFVGVNLSGWNPPTNRDISAMTYTGATNIPWAAINANTHANGVVSGDFTGVDMAGWNPSASTKIASTTYKDATNMPWTAINAITQSSGYFYCDFRGLNLAAWNPAASKNVSGVYYTGATNIPWAALNANTNAAGYSGSTFTNVDLSLWNPAPTAKLSNIKYGGATNIPWVAINANTNAAGFAQSSFSSIDLAGWNPAVTANISSIALTDVTNIPWAAINANTHASGFQGVKFGGIDLALWNPPPTRKITWVYYFDVTNIPWAAINANTNASGLANSRFQNVDLTGFNPTGKILTGVAFDAGMRSPSDFVLATGITPGPGTKWIDGTYPWGP